MKFGWGTEVLHVPASFLSGYERLSWTETLWGYRNGCISHHALIELACLQIKEEDDPAQPLVDLSWLGPKQSYDAETLAERLAGSESAGDPDKIKQKWLHLILAWLIHEWDRFPNPPGMLESILVEFEYPGEFSEINRIVAGAAGAERLPGQKRDQSDAALLEILKQHFMNLGIPLPARH